MPLFREGLNDIQRIKLLAKVKGSILTSPIRMKNQPWLDASGGYCVVQRLNGRMLINSAGEPMCNHFAGKQIQNNAKIIGPPTRLQISEVTHPNRLIDPGLKRWLSTFFMGSPSLDSACLKAGFTVLMDGRFMVFIRRYTRP